MAKGKEKIESLSLVVMHFTFLYLLPERRRWRYVWYNRGSSPVDSVLVAALQRGQGSPGELGHSLHHCVGISAHDSRAAVPHSDESGWTQQRSCRSCWESLVTCQTSAASSGSTAAVLPRSLNKVYCTVYIVERKKNVSSYSIYF